MNPTQDNLRKAAVLIDSLDRRSADALLDQMNEEQANRIRQAVLVLDDVSPAEREHVMSEFLAGQKLRSGVAARDIVTDDGGVEIEASLAARLSEDHDERAERAAAPTERPSPFQLLHEADAGVIARFLDRENPQAVAVVLAHLPPERSAGVLARLTPDRQIDVVRRIVHLSETPPEVLLDVEHELGSRLSEQLTNMHRQEEGLAAIRRILGAADASLRKTMLAHVASADASLSDRLSNSPNDETRPATAHRQSQTVHRGADARRDKPGSSSSFASPRPETFLRRPAPKPRPAWMSASAGPPVGPRQANTDSEESREESGNGPVPAATPDGLRDNGISLEQPGPREVQSGLAPALSREAEPPAARFDDVARLTDEALATLFSEVDTDVAVLALTAADPKFVRRLLKQLPRRDAKSLAKQLAQPVPMRLREIERAQQEVADVAQDLDLLGHVQQYKKRERLAAVA